MLQISNLQLSLDENPQSLESLIMKKLRLRPGRLTSWKIVKESLDARKKPLRFVYTVLVETPGEAQILKKKLTHVSAAEPYRYQPPKPVSFDGPRPVVVGFGPCGMFAALLLAEAGLRPIVLERGADVDQRVKDVETYWQGGPLNPQSNVQFGEGGAGTFSDGKLTTRVKDCLLYTSSAFRSSRAMGSRNVPHYWRSTAIRTAASTLSVMFCPATS